MTQGSGVYVQSKEEILWKRDIKAQHLIFEMLFKKEAFIWEGSGREVIGFL